MDPIPGDAVTIISWWICVMFYFVFDCPQWQLGLCSIAASHSLHLGSSSCCSTAATQFLCCCSLLMLIVVLDHTRHIQLLIISGWLACFTIWSVLFICWLVSTTSKQRKTTQGALQYFFPSIFSLFPQCSWKNVVCLWYIYYPWWCLYVDGSTIRSILCSLSP